jgi:hypothetical protein
MATAKIEFTLGTITFSGEGEETWVSDQLDKLLQKAPDLIKIALEAQPIGHPTAIASSQVRASSDDAISSQTLPNFLRAKDARSQVRKFLATAIWLHAKGNPRLSTTDVNKALRDFNQSRLTNASDCLNSNVGQGYIEKEGRQFFVTDEGRRSLPDRP